MIWEKNVLFKKVYFFIIRFLILLILFYIIPIFLPSTFLGTHVRTVLQVVTPMFLLRYMYKATRLRLVVLYPDKTRPASLLNNFKDIPGKACLKRVDNNAAFVNAGN